MCTQDWKAPCCLVHSFQLEAPAPQPPPPPRVSARPGFPSQLCHVLTVRVASSDFGPKLGYLVSNPGAPLPGCGTWDNLPVSLLSLSEPRAPDLP